MARSAVTRMCDCPNLSAMATSFSSVVNVVENSDGGAWMKGRYLIVATGRLVSHRTELKPLQAGTEQASPITILVNCQNKSLNTDLM